MSLFGFIFGCIFIFSFVYLFIIKLKLYRRRIILKQMGMIKGNPNLAMITFLEAIFWIVPVWSFRKVKDADNLNLLKTADLCLFYTAAFALASIWLSK
ncbi:MAG: hypothetical protein WDO14_24380 [Bacteroidota bacterium]